MLVNKMLVPKQYRCTHSATCLCTKGHLSEDAIYLVFQHLNWNPRSIAVMSCVCKWFDEIAKRVFWKEFCRARAPKMMLDMQSCGSHSVDGNWKALGKLLIHCSGCSLFGDDGDVGIFRGMFKSFSVSRVRKMLIDRQAQFHPTQVCPYCKAKLWDMLQAKMIPRSACIRLCAYDDSIECFVCLNGHMLGACTLLPLSDSEEASDID
ncbi:EID1-like F-box protein 2 isoform X2 [Zingiber officinale]|uniref:EID1-like F-box protein 2 isoform X2 n=1 Tax=Zingiber officinale TaxID=94328 RepID=UPI001C4C4A99|nr:EID1-like F-box protein 2 isoform X2 [Zingiber officinale]